MSDLHAGVPHAGLDKIRRAVDALNAREPDVHLLLGDYLDASQFLRRELAPEGSPTSSRGCDSPLGTIAVIGNHDWRNSGDRMWRALSAAGITVLEDQAVETDGRFWVAGLADMRHRQPDIGAALRDVPRDAPMIVLSHDPDMFPGVPDPRRRSRSPGTRTAGRSRSRSSAARSCPPTTASATRAGHIVEHGRHLLVTSGVGTSGLPIRLLTPPEVVIVTLRNL